MLHRQQKNGPEKSELRIRFVGRTKVRLGNLPNLIRISILKKFLHWNASNLIAYPKGKLKFSVLFHHTSKKPVEKKF